MGVGWEGEVAVGGGDLEGRGGDLDGGGAVVEGGEDWEGSEEEGEGVEEVGFGALVGEDLFPFFGGIREEVWGWSDERREDTETSE